MFMIYVTFNIYQITHITKTKTRKIHFNFQQKVGVIKKKPLVMTKFTQVGYKNKCQILCPK